MRESPLGKGIVVQVQDNSCHLSGMLGIRLGRTAVREEGGRCTTADVGTFVRSS